MSQDIKNVAEHKVHPFIAWVAVFNFAMVFSLAPSVMLAQAATPDMSSGSTAVAMRVTETTFLNHAKKLAVAEDGQSSEETTAPKKKWFGGERKESECMRSCRTTKTTCAREASGNLPEMHACFETFHSCVMTCEEGKTAARKAAIATASEAQKDYLSAVAAAKEARQEAIEKAEADYKAAVQKAKDELEAAKSAAKSN